MTGASERREELVLLTADAPRPLLSRSAEAHLGRRHQEVLDHLERLFLDRGFATLTISDIAADAGCSRRTLYELAPSKDQLVHLVIDRFLHKKGRTALAALDPGQPFATQLRAYLEGGVTFTWEERFADDLADDAAARRLVDRHYRFMMTVVERLVAMGIEAGEFRPLNPAVVAATVTGATLYVDTPAINELVGTDVSHTLQQILDLVLPSLTLDS